MKTIISFSLIISAVPSLAFSQNAQDVTQSVFDQHKSADPTNSDRSLTEKNKRTEVRISDVPLATGPSHQTLQRAHQLREQRDVFIQKQVKIEKAETAKSLVGFDAGMAKKEAGQAWYESGPGKELRQLEREIAKAKKGESNTRISDVPLARPKR